ncbi:hypothetical protein BDW74DRAFT_46454 [Aspergillus multicolor]|uniref:uncharacterized protein n=1 Tax=Aspergillus multicolor TaxID=41759 RepID=UPI003CCCCDC5
MISQMAFLSVTCLPRICLRAANVRHLLRLQRASSSKVDHDSDAIPMIRAGELAVVISITVHPILTVTLAQSVHNVAIFRSRALDREAFILLPSSSAFL